MATKLKNMRLTSVDLVKAGANQEADICLYKSADAEHTSQEAPEAPTEAEKNIFKRFIGWLRDGGAEDGTEPDGTIEKGNAPEPDAEPADIYKSAILESVHSILADDSLTNDQKSAMIEKSLDQYHDAMAEIYKYNENHDRLGRFASAGGGGGRGNSSGAGGGTSETARKKKLAQLESEYNKLRDRMAYSYNERTIAAINREMDKIVDQMNAILNKSGGGGRAAVGKSAFLPGYDGGIDLPHIDNPNDNGIDRFDEIEEINS